MHTFMRRASVREIDLRAWIPILTGVLAVVVVLGMPQFLEGTAHAQAVPSLVVTGVAANHSSARVFFQPVAGARDYRLYDAAAPTNVKYAGLAHLTPSTACPGTFCLNHFLA